MLKPLLKSKLTLTFVLMLSIMMAGKAQTYTATTPFDTVFVNGDTLKFTFTNLPAGAWGNVSVTAYYEGDFGDNTEYIDFYGPGMLYIGTAGPYTSGTDCDGIDSITFTFPASLLAPLLPAASLQIIGLASIEVDPGNCDASRAMLSGSYNYCGAGIPAQIASFTFSDSVVCPFDGTVVLTGLPTGGTFTGISVSGNSFNPTGLTAGAYNITYTATDNIGCVTATTKAVRVSPSPDLESMTECPGTSINLYTNNLGTLVWYTNSSLTNVYDTTSITDPVFSTPHLEQTTTYYVAAINEINEFYVDTLLATNSALVDHDLLTGDDRGGIAVNQNYVYVVGDDFSARYNLDLTNGVALPKRDGLFSDLSTGKLYTLWDGTTDPNDVNGTYSPSGLVELDSNLALTNNIVSFNTQLTLNDQGTGIFAGVGIVILYSSLDMHFYAVNIVTGNVVDLGVHNISFYGSENWSDWGVAEYDGIDYSVLYRSGSGVINHLNLSNDVIKRAGQFTDLGDLASLTVSPWNNRWYFHHESSSEFGGVDETLGYADAGYTLNTAAGTLGCYNEFIININTVDLGPDTIICEGETVVLYAGTGYTEYTWNGANTNFNAVAAFEQGVYDVEVLDADGCHLYDTVNVIVSAAPNPTIDFGSNFIYCSNAGNVVLTGTPANGTFSGTGVSGTNFNPTAAGVGVHEITYTVTGNNGCTGTGSDFLVVENCTGIDDINLSAISLFPNPSTGMVNLQFNNVNAADVNISAYDMQGRELFRRETNTTAGNNTMALDLNHLGSGIYQLRINAGGNTQIERLVIQQ